MSQFEVFAIIGLITGVFGMFLSVILFFALKMGNSMQIGAMQREISTIAGDVKAIRTTNYEELADKLTQVQKKIGQVETDLETTDISAKNFQRKWARKMGEVAKQTEQAEQVTEVDNPGDVVPTKKANGKYQLPEGFVMPGSVPASAEGEQMNLADGHYNPNDFFSENF